jgi:hypothetical protein
VSVVLKNESRRLQYITDVPPEWNNLIRIVTTVAYRDVAVLERYRVRVLICSSIAREPYYIVHYTIVEYHVPQWRGSRKAIDIRKSRGLPVTSYQKFNPLARRAHIRFKPVNLFRGQQPAVICPGPCRYTHILLLISPPRELFPPGVRNKATFLPVEHRTRNICSFVIRARAIFQQRHRRVHTYFLVLGCTTDVREVFFFFFFFFSGRFHLLPPDAAAPVHCSHYV